MKRATCLVLSWLLLISPVLAAAPAEPVEIKLFKIPKGLRIQVDGVTYQAFTFEEWKIILAVDQELRAKTEQLKKQENINILLARIDKDWLSKELLYQASINSWKTQYDDMFKDWKEENKAKHKAKAGGIFRHVTLLLGGALTIVGTIALVSSRL